MDKPRLLRASPHSVDYEAIRRSYDDRGVPKPMEDVAAVTQAAEESAYTSSPGAALQGAGEEVSREEQDRQSRLAREKHERMVLSPLLSIDKQLEKLENSGLYASAELRFVRKRLGKIGDDALRRATV